MKSIKYILLFITSSILIIFACNTSTKEEHSNGVSIDIPSNASIDEVTYLATKVRPSTQQIDYQQREMLGFIHFGMNTFTGKEWGTGKEDPMIFNPTKLDADSWVKTFKDAGITGVILVAKHHDGFCLWPSKYTKHSIANCPWKNGQGDIVKDVAEACKKYNMKLCLYLSPWDMHEKTYGTEEYNDYYVHQMEELLTNYGPVYLFWFDGAGTVNKDGKQTVPLDWNRFFNRAKELQPNILLSGIKDIRWVGNEAGRGHETEWCVQGINGTHGEFANQSDSLLGTIEYLMKKEKLVWYPSRGGLPIRKGWFYNPQDNHTTKSLQYLINSYFSTVGQNSNLLLNLSPDTLGQIPQQDANRLIEFGNLIQEMKKTDYAKGAKVTPISGWSDSTPSNLIVDNDPFTSWHTHKNVCNAEAVISLRKAATINVIKIQENIRDYGQRVKSFAIDAWIDNQWKEIKRSTTIGFRKMIYLPHPITTDKFRVRFLDARVSISWSNFSLYFITYPIVSDTIYNKEYVSQSQYKISFDGIIAKDNLESLKDNNPQTYWNGELSNSHENAFIFKIQPQEIKGLLYRPVDLKDCGHIEYYTIYISNDGKTWGNPIAKGRFGNIQNNPVEQLVTFKKQNVRFIKFVINGVTSANREIKIADLMLYK